MILICAFLVVFIEEEIGHKLNPYISGGLYLVFMELSHLLCKKYEQWQFDRNYEEQQSMPKNFSPSTPAAPETTEPKQSYLMTAANGMQVWVPEDKLEAWQAAQSEESYEAKRKRELTTEKILEHMDQIRRESQEHSAHQSCESESDNNT
jgi:hypothetical protein